MTFTIIVTIGLDSSKVIIYWYIIVCCSLQQWCQYLTVDNDDILDKLEREKFDIAVMDAFIGCVYLIPHRLQIPFITCGLTLDPLTVRVPWLPSFVPNVLFPFSDQMTFIERLKNTAASIVIPLIIPLCSDMEQEVLDKFRRYGYFSSPSELVSKSALWFLTRDDVLDYPQPMMPNMVNVGGLTVKRATGELPPDIKNFLDGAKKGGILVSFGSAMSRIPAHMVEKFSEAFGRLDGYRVIWRLKNVDNVKLADNVLIRQWLPQNDILAQLSVKLFISHG